jgi:hypothetical protein
VLLDSLMHRDLVPFAPFSDANPVLGVVSQATVEFSCVLAGVLGLCLLGIRGLRSARHRP